LILDDLKNQQNHVLEYIIKIKIKMHSCRMQNALLYKRERERYSQRDQ